MQYGKIGASDKPVSRLVQGTTMLSTERLDESLALLDGVFELGCTAFDNAQSYFKGDCERTFGKWLQSRGNREQVYLITKGAHPTIDRNRVTPYDITADLHDSLARLHTDYIDLYLLHRDDLSVPVSTIIDVLNEHYKAGKIRAFGGSNWTHERIAEANAYARANGLQPFIASSPNFSLAEQFHPPWDGCISISGEKGKADREWYAQQQMPLITWSSIAGGFFSGRITRDIPADADPDWVRAYCYESNFQRLDRAEQLAKEKSMSVSQIAVAYVLSQSLDIYAIIGCATVDEFASNLAASAVTLTPDEINWLENGD